MQEDVVEKKEFESQEGQSLILIALMMVAMVGMLGLALDGGRVFAARRTSQNAADSAAFGAVRLLATRTLTATEPVIWDTIVKFAMANEIVTKTDILAYFIDKSANNICRIPNCGGIPANASGVRVTTTLQMQPYFIDVLIGKQTIPVRAVAAAQSGNPAPISVMPMVVPCNQLERPDCNYGYGNMVTIKGDQQGNGSVQWLDFGSCTLDEYLSLTCTSGKITADPNDTYWDPLNPTKWTSAGPDLPPDISPWRKTKTGQVAAVAATLNCWLVPSGPGCWQSVPYPGSRLWLVPIENHNNGDTTGNNLWYHIFEIGAFEFFGYYFDNGSCNWVGKTGGNCKSGLPTSLQQCADANGGKGIKCLEGIFQPLSDVPIHPGVCQLLGTNTCGIGMSQ